MLILSEKIRSASESYSICTTAKGNVLAESFEFLMTTSRSFSLVHNTCGTEPYCVSGPDHPPIIFSLLKLEYTSVASRLATKRSASGLEGIMSLSSGTSLIEDWESNFSFSKMKGSRAVAAVVS